MRASPHLSLVIPAYNEERRIVPTLSKVLTYLAGQPYTSEVIIVSDGSTDNTERVVLDAFASLPADGKVRGAFRAYLPNAGKGKAVRTGVAATTGSFVAFTDADLSTPIEEVDRALGELDGRFGAPGRYAVVIGSRAVSGAEVRRYQPLHRRISARCFNVVRDGVVGLRGLHDTQCGLKVFEGDVARYIFGRQAVDGFMFDVETMYIAQRLALPVLELGVQWADAPDSKVKLTSGFRILPDLTRIRMRHRHLTPADAPTGALAVARR